MSVDELLVVVLRQWREVGGAVEQATAAVLADLGLSETGAAVLTIVGERAEPPTMRDLAQPLRCDPSNVTLVATKLEHDGLVERRPHPTDGRSRVLVLTARGKATRTRMLDRLVKTTPLAALSAREQQQLLRLLRRVTR